MSINYQRINAVSSLNVLPSWKKPSKKKKSASRKPRETLKKRKSKKRQRLPQLKLGSKRDRSLHLAKLPLLRNQLQQLLHVHAQQHLHPLPRQNYILAVVKRRMLPAIVICTGANRGIRLILIETVTA